MPAGEFADQSRQSWPLAGSLGTWHLGFERFATGGASALMEDEMGEVHLERWQFDHLMGVITNGASLISSI
jgi:hypothetical protein